MPNVSLVPENDSSVLFTTAGMHPLVPYLLGEVHPLGKRLCSLQRCLRTDDIDNVGDGFHHTFFEMLGNWSLGDYWKEEALSWSWEFLTKILAISPPKISVSCFAGDKDAPKDEESAKLWQKLGVPRERIFFLPKKDNWWGPAGVIGPCGPDSEMFFDTGKPKCSPKCDVSCQCGKYLEIWNDVFMQYNKTAAGKYEPLKQKNVDTGMGVERVVAVTSGFDDDDYRTELFWPIIKKIEEISGQKYRAETQKPMRIIADHLRATVFLISDGVKPANVEQGYVLRRLIRRVIMKGRTLGMKKSFMSEMSKLVISLYQREYPGVRDYATLVNELGAEEEKFAKALERGLRELGKYKGINDKIAFYLYESYGLPLEVIEEIARERGQKIDKQSFEKALEQHQQKSRAGAEKRFKGGLADHSEESKKYHTIAHLLHAALRKILGTQVRQAGQNITAERLRFDFTYPEKLTVEQLKEVEDLVNQKIKENLPVKMEVMNLAQAKNAGALAFFEEKYGEKVKVYSINSFSKEVCGGPHVGKTREVGSVKIIKEEAVGSGKRRIYAKLAQAWK